MRGIRLVEQKSTASIFVRIQQLPVHRSPSIAMQCAGNARAWAGQAEYPPKPVWAFGWFMARARLMLHAVALHYAGRVSQSPCRRCMTDERLDHLRILKLLR